MEQVNGKYEYEKWTLRLSIFVGFVGILLILLSSGFESHSNKLVREFFNEVGSMSTSDELDTKIIPDQLKVQAKALIDNKYSGIRAIGMKFNSVGQTNLDGQFEYTYPTAVTLNEFGTLKYESYDQNSLLYSGGQGLTARVRDTDIQFNIDVVQLKFTRAFHTVTSLLLGCYWSLFAIWGMIKIHRQGDFSSKWVLSLISFNILGYWLYTEKRTERKTTVCSFLIYLLGACILYNGIQTLLTTTRGTVIMYKLGFSIALDDLHIYLYGSTFLTVGVLLLFVPSIAKKALQKLLMS